MKRIGLMVILGMMVIGIGSAEAATTTIGLNSAISYQNASDFDWDGDGAATTTTFDDSVRLKDLDGNWGPTTTGSVTQGYYATGGAQEWFDGVSVNFDLSSVSYSQIQSAKLMAYIKTGSYSSASWHHYNLYPGALNATDQDQSAPWGTSFDYNAYANGGWISCDIQA